MLCCLVNNFSVCTALHCILPYSVPSHFFDCSSSTVVISALLFHSPHFTYALSSLSSILLFLVLSFSFFSSPIFLIFPVLPPSFFFLHVHEQIHPNPNSLLDVSQGTARERSRLTQKWVNGPFTRNFNFFFEVEFCSWMLTMIYLISVNLSVLVCACEYIHEQKWKKKRKNSPNFCFDCKIRGSNFLIIP